MHTSAVGYRLDAPVDATVACEDLELAAGDPGAIRRALARWVAPALQEFADESWAVADAVRLDERRESAVEDLADALIAHRRADEAAACVYPEVLPMAGEVAFNGVTDQGPVSAYVGRLVSLLGRHDEAEPYLLDALVTAEAFGWEYNRATSLIALAQNQLRGTGNLDARGEQWLITAEHLCAKYGFASWVKRTEAVRARLVF